MTRHIDPALDPFKNLDGEYDAGGALPTTPLYVPTAIALNGDRLVWNADGDWGSKSPGKSLVFDFAGLSDAQPEAILRFAQRWGVLRICDKHHVPITHRVRGFRLTGERLTPSDCRLPRCKGESYELVEDWRTFARLARAILHLVACHARGKRGSDEDVALLMNAPARPALRIPNERTRLLDAVNVWLRLSNVGLFVAAHGTRTTPVFSGGLFGAIGLQLAAAVTGTAGVAFCSYCGTSYIPKRAPSAGRRNFCTTCGRKVAVRMARRDARQRRIQTRQPAGTRRRTPRA